MSQEKLPAVTRRGVIARTENESVTDWHNNKKNKWLTVDCPDRLMIGRWLSAEDGRRAMRSGFYPDGTVIVNPLKKQAFTVIARKAHFSQFPAQEQY